MSDTTGAASAASQPATAGAEATTEADIDTGEGLAEEAASKNPEAAKSLKKLFKLKVDGEEFDEEIDLSDEEAIKKHLQFSKVAQKRMGETAQVQKDMQELLKVLKSTPDAVLAELGVNVEDFATQVLNKKLEDMQKSPEQKELEKLRQDAKKAQEETEKLKAEKDQESMLRMQEKARQEFDDELTTALENEPDLPKNSYVVKRVADLMIYALENNIKAGVKDIIPIVKREIHGEWYEMFSKMPEDVLERVVGKDNIGRVRKALIKKQKEAAPTANNVMQTGTSEQNANSKPKEKIKISDFIKGLGTK